MTAFEDKVKAAQEAQPTSVDPGYKRAVWTLMIACGGATREQTGHGAGTDMNGQIEVDMTLTREVLRDLSETTIKWDECSDPSEAYAWGFMGTFTNSHAEIPYLEGWLQLHDRKVYWAVTVGGDGDDFGRVVRGITMLELTLDEAIEELTYRLDRYADDPWGFGYTCVLPEI